MNTRSRGLMKRHHAHLQRLRRLASVANKPYPIPPFQHETTMRLLLAIFLPFLSFFTIGRPFAGLFCLILQITLIGWIPAALWAVFALSQWKTDQKIKRAAMASATNAAQAAASVTVPSPAPNKTTVRNEHDA